MLPNPCVSLKHDQLIPIYIVVNEKELSDKGAAGGEKK
jgi:hypothetical protein